MASLTFPHLQGTKGEADNLHRESVGGSPNHATE